MFLRTISSKQLEHLKGSTFWTRSRVSMTRYVSPSVGWSVGRSVGRSLGRSPFYPYICRKVWLTACGSKVTNN